MSEGSEPRRPIIQLLNLRKEFGGTVAVNDLSFEVNRGEIFGFIGPNGAGKTTTIRILSTLLDPTAGEARIDGACVQDQVDEVRRMIGYLPDSFGVYEGITVSEYLDFFAAAFRIKGQARRRVVRDVMELTDLGRLSDRLVSNLSRGMKQRLCLAKTLVHDPKVLILDEPASALDPRARIELRALLKELRGMGKTIFISSHILTELSDICTSVGIIERGRLLYLGGVEEVEKRSTRVSQVEIRLHREHPEAVELLRNHPKVGRAEARGVKLSLEYRGEPEEFYEVVKILADHRVPILTIEEVSRNLERLFLEITNGDVQ